MVCSAAMRKGNVPRKLGVRAPTTRNGAPTTRSGALLGGAVSRAGGEIRAIVVGEAAVPGRAAMGLSAEVAAGIAGAHGIPAAAAVAPILRPAVAARAARTLGDPAGDDRVVLRLPGGVLLCAIGKTHGTGAPPVASL